MSKELSICYRDQNYEKPVNIKDEIIAFYPLSNKLTHGKKYIVEGLSVGGGLFLKNNDGKMCYYSRMNFKGFYTLMTKEERFIKTRYEIKYIDSNGKIIVISDITGSKVKKIIKNFKKKNIPVEITEKGEIIHISYFE